MGEGGEAPFSVRRSKDRYFDDSNSVTRTVSYDVAQGLKLLLNGYDSGHSDEINGLLVNAQHLEYMVAFARFFAREAILKRADDSSGGC